MIAESILGGMVLILIVIGQIERHRAAKRETQLIKAIIAKNLPEYTQSLEDSKSRIKEAKAESKLAEKALELAAVPPNMGIPI